MGLQFNDMGITLMGKEIIIIKQLLTFSPDAHQDGGKSRLVPFSIPSESNRKLILFNVSQQ